MPPKCIALRAYTKYNARARHEGLEDEEKRTCSHRQIRNDNAESDLPGVPLAEVDEPACIRPRLADACKVHTGEN